MGTGGIEPPTPGFSVLAYCQTFILANFRPICFTGGIEQTDRFFRDADMSQGMIVLGYIFSTLFLFGAIVFHDSNLAIAASIWFVGIGLGILSQAIERQTRRNQIISDDPPEVRPIK